MTTDNLAIAPPGRTFVLNIGEMLSFLALAALTLEPLFGTIAAAGFLAIGVLLLLSQPAHTLRTLIGAWPLLILPAYCLASVFWSQFPDNTLRYGIQLAVTLAVAIVIPARVPAATLLRGLFIIYSIGVFVSIAIGRNSDESAWVGIFGSKNAFAAYIAVYAIISIALVFDSGARRWLRAAALMGALVSLPLLIRAQSAGALAVIGPSVLVVLAVVLARRLSDLQKIFILGCVALGAAALAFVVSLYGNQLLAVALETSGKDSTLTGRTDLWSAGLSLIAERPWFGVGYRAFWVRDYGPAEQLWAMFNEQSGAGFNFHDLYISNAVELGLVGLAIEVAIIYVTAGMLLFLAVVRPSHIVAFLLGLQVLLILRSFVEVEVFYEFSVRSILTYGCAIYAARELLQWRLETRLAHPRFQLREA